MKKFTQIILFMIISFPVIGIMVSSCEEEADCSLISRAMLHASFYTLNEADPPQWVYTKIDSITVTALGTDSIIINDIKEPDYIDLPLQYTVDSTALILHFTNLLRDTVIFHHTNIPYFLSLECGYDMRQTITRLRYSTHVLDSINIRNYNTSKNGSENLRFYYTY